MLFAPGQGEPEVNDRFHVKWECLLVWEISGKEIGMNFPEVLLLLYLKKCILLK